MDPGSVPVQQQMHDHISEERSPTGPLPPAVPLAITPTFSTWTHTSDDSYIYQLSLVLATAIVSFGLIPRLHVLELWKRRGAGGGALIIMLGRSRATVEPPISEMPGRSMPGFH